MRHFLRRSLGFAALVGSLNACGGESASPLILQPSGQGGAGAEAGASAGNAGATVTAQGGALDAAGSAGSAPVGGGAGGASSAGAGGAGAGSPGSAGAGGGVVLTDPGTDGDGDFTIGPNYKSDAANTFMNAPVGKQITFQMASKDSTTYPGRNGAYTRNVWAYIPSQYVPGTPAPFIVVQDGYFAVWFGNDVPHKQNTAQTNLPGTANLPRILDNLIAAGKLPKMIALFVESGGGDGGNSERGLEYDTVSGKFAEFIDKEVLPRTISEAQTQLQLDLKFTTDPEGRATLGGSSGGAASFSMAWWHPDLFRRVIAYSGTFVRQISPEDPLYPHGCWAYHDYDPYNAAMPNGVVMKEATNKPLRIWIEAGTNDMGANSGPTSYRDFRLANQRMAAEFKLKAYHYHYDDAQGAGHLDGNAVAQTLPAALQYVWRGYPLN
jgi:enterochelin esterase family protein